MTAWERLGLSVRLVVSAEEVEAAFRKASEGAHPDAGGESGVFEELREARDLLREDYRRLGLWLERQGVLREHSGEISEEVGALFARVHGLLEEVKVWRERGEGVSSALGKALWQREGLGLKGRVEGELQGVQDWQAELVSRFPDLEDQAARGEFGEALRVLGELGFLRKWKAQLQGCYGQLWEALV